MLGKKSGSLEICANIKGTTANICDATARLNYSRQLTRAVSARIMAIIQSSYRRRFPGPLMHVIDLNSCHGDQRQAVGNFYIVDDLKELSGQHHSLQRILLNVGGFNGHRDARLNTPIGFGCVGGNFLHKRI